MTDGVKKLSPAEKSQGYIRNQYLALGKYRDELYKRLCIEQITIYDEVKEGKEE